MQEIASTIFLLCAGFFHLFSYRLISIKLTLSLSKVFKKGRIPFGLCGSQCVNFFSKNVILELIHNFCQLCLFFCFDIFLFIYKLKLWKHNDKTQLCLSFKKDQKTFLCFVDLCVPDSFQKCSRIKGWQKLWKAVKEV